MPAHTCNCFFISNLSKEVTKVVQRRARVKEAGCSTRGCFTATERAVSAGVSHQPSEPQQSMGGRPTAARSATAALQILILGLHFFPPSHLPLALVDFCVKHPMDITPPRPSEASDFQTPDISVDATDGKDAGKDAYIPAFIGELRAACPPDRIVMMEQLRRLAVTVNFTLAAAEEEMIALGDVRDVPQLPMDVETDVETDAPFEA